jgi:hypothetical protein
MIGTTGIDPMGMVAPDKTYEAEPLGSPSPAGLTRDRTSRRHPQLSAIHVSSRAPGSRSA